jgi:hypothetical protein
MSMTRPARRMTPGPAVVFLTVGIGCGDGWRPTGEHHLAGEPPGSPLVATSDRWRQPRIWLNATCEDG